MKMFNSRHYQASALVSSLTQLCFAALVLLCIDPARADAQHLSYSVREINVANAFFYSINEPGQVVGACLFSESGSYHGCLWENGVLRDLGGLGEGQSAAFGNSRRGSAVGWSHVGSSNFSHATIWEHDQVIDLGTVLGGNSAGMGINNRDQAVGVSDSDELDQCGVPALIAVLWDRGVPLPLGKLGGYSSSPSAINESATVVGSSDVDITTGCELGNGPVHAFIWRNGQMQDLGSFGDDSFNSFATDIDNHGRIVGASDFLAAKGTRHAVRWENSIIRDLGVVSGDTASVAYATNDRGQVVGASGELLDYFEPFRAFIWQDGKMVDLNTVIPADFNSHLLLALSINNRGQILAIDTGYRYFVLSPKGTGPGPIKDTGAAEFERRLRRAKRSLESLQFPKELRRKFGFDVPRNRFMAR